MLTTTLRVLFRLLSYSIVAINLLTFGIFLYVIAPYTSYFFFNDIRFWKYLKYFHRYYRYSLSYLWITLWRKQELLPALLPLTAPAMDHPDPTLFHLAPDWPYPADSCGTCNNCCTFVVTCCFLNTTNNSCVCYGSLFWRYFNCGRFPSSRQLLKTCDCRKFISIDDNQTVNPLTAKQPAIINEDL